MGRGGGRGERGGIAVMEMGRGGGGGERRGKGGEQWMGKSGFAECDL